MKNAKFLSTVAKPYVFESLIKFPALINWTIPFEFKGCRIVVYDVIHIS